MKLKNIVWNFGGLGAPLIIAALTIPSLIGMIGLERFGLLALAWGLIGFAGIFDLGIGRATTQTIARLRGGDQLEQVPAVLKTAATLSFRTGVGGAILLGIAVLAGAHTHIKFAAALNTEVTIAAYFLALAIPIQSMSAMFRGVNEAFENFREISLVRIGLGVANFLVPFCVAIFTTNLAVLVFTLLLSRMIAFFLYRKFAKACLTRVLPTNAQNTSVKASREIAKQLLSFGGWVTVSGVVYPLMMQADRFLIGSVISTVAVAAYVIPYEMVVQSLILVGAITTVIFPSLTALISSKPQAVMKMFYRWLGVVVFMMTLVAIALAITLPHILNLWLGDKLIIESIRVGQILCAGLVPYTIGSMYVALIHAHNRSDITGKAHILEIPVFLMVLYWMTAEYGVHGAAWTWVVRVTFDAAILVIWFACGRKDMALPCVAVNSTVK
jgi:O-antigen/teichoic acid export membrane protein